MSKTLGSGVRVDKSHCTSWSCMVSSQRSLFCGTSSIMLWLSRTTAWFKQRKPICLNWWYGECGDSGAVIYLFTYLSLFWLIIIYLYHTTLLRNLISNIPKHSKIIKLALMFHRKFFPAWWKGCCCTNISCLCVLFPLVSFVFDRNNKKMPLGDDCHDWKKKTTDVKEKYDFKEILGT